MTSKNLVESEELWLVKNKSNCTQSHEICIKFWINHNENEWVLKPQLFYSSYNYLLIFYSSANSKRRHNQQNFDESEGESPNSNCEVIWSKQGLLKLMIIMDIQFIRNSFWTKNRSKLNMACLSFFFSSCYQMGFYKNKTWQYNRNQRSAWVDLIEVWSSAKLERRMAFS